MEKKLQEAGNKISALEAIPKLSDASNLDSDVQQALHKLQEERSLEHIQLMELQEQKQKIEQELEEHRTQRVMIQSELDELKRTSDQAKERSTLESNEYQEKIAKLKNLLSVAHNQFTNHKVDQS